MIDLQAFYELKKYTLIIKEMENLLPGLSLLSHSVLSDSATPWTLAHQAPLSMGFPRQEYCSGLLFPIPRDLPNPGIETQSPILADGYFTIEPPGKPLANVDYSSVQLCIII